MSNTSTLFTLLITVLFKPPIGRVGLHYFHGIGGLRLQLTRGRLHHDRLPVGIVELWRVPSRLFSWASYPSPRTYR